MAQEFVNKLTEEFRNLTQRMNGDIDSQYAELRKKAFDKFLYYGIPTRKHEEWKYTNINFLNKHDFKPETKRIDKIYNLRKLNVFDFGEQKVNKIVLVNGFFSGNNTEIVTKSEKIKIKSLNEELISGNKLIKPQLSDDYYQANPFAALNHAFANDGVYINIGDKVSLKEPIHIIHICDSSAQDSLISPLNIIVIGKESQIDIIESFYGVGKNIRLLNYITDVIVGESSTCNFYRSQFLDDNTHHINDLNVELKDNGILNTYTYSTGGITTRNNLNISLNAEGCEAMLNGFYLTDKSNLIDNHILVEHHSPNCRSNQHYKGILDDKSTANFNGKIVVFKDAQKTNAYQLNKNIQLSDEAQLNSKPQLEIYADDVKCSHGGASGSLDEEAMFYLRSRGIDEDSARRLLLSAFAREIVEMIKIDSLRDYVTMKFEEKLNS